MAIKIIFFTEKQNRGKLVQPLLYENTEKKNHINYSQLLFIHIFCERFLRKKKKRELYCNLDDLLAESKHDFCSHREIFSISSAENHHATYAFAPIFLSHETKSPTNHRFSLRWFGLGSKHAIREHLVTKFTLMTPSESARIRNFSIWQQMKIHLAIF